MAWKGVRLGLAVGAAACLAAVVGAGIWGRPERRAAYAVAFSPRGDRVAAIAEVEPRGTGRLWVWDVATGRQVATAAVSDRPLSLAYAPDGAALATGGWNGAVELRDADAGRVLRSFPGHSTPVRGLAFTPDGRTLAAGASDGRVLVWDLESGRERTRLDRGRSFPVNAMAISRDGRFLAAAGGLGAGAVSLWDLATAQPLKPASLPAAAGEPIAFAPDRAILAARAASPAGSVVLIDLDGDRVASNIPAGGVRSIAFSPDGRLVLTGGDDETVSVRDADTGRSVAAYVGHRHRPDALGDDFRNLIADVGLAEHRVQNSIWSIAFSPDGTRLASAGHDGAAWLWGIPGRDAPRPPDRALLPRPSKPGWLPVLQIALALAASALLAAAVSRPCARGGSGSMTSGFLLRAVIGMPSANPALPASEMMGDGAFGPDVAH